MKTHIVMSGSFSVGVRKKEVLQAFLGSCVGITLCDREAGVGGLIHLLLPDPPSNDTNFRPEVSASSGLPIFLGAILGAGAKKERLEACMAGGSLISPLSKTDLILDLGGRTSENAQQFLAEAGIPIVQSEIGGYFSCRLNLDLNTFESSIDPIAMPIPSSFGKDFVAPDPGQLDDAISKILPIPQVALKIIRMIANDSVSFSEIAREILLDQVLSAKILRLCNSVTVHASMKVESVEMGLLRIGEKNLLPLALAVSMESFITNTNQGYSLCKGGLFNHSVYTAGIARRLGEISGKVRPGLAYTAGLLHDIGKVVLDQYMDSAYPLFYRKLRNKRNDLNTAEKDCFGISHTEAGLRLGRLWDLPEPIIQTIAHHHCPTEARGYTDLVHLVYLADFLSSRFMVGQELEKMDASHLEASLKAIDFDPEQLSSLVAAPQSLAPVF